MWERLPITAVFLLVAFLGIGLCWLMWRKSKDKREGRAGKPSVVYGIDLGYENPSALIKATMVNGELFVEEINIIQMPPKEIQPCQRGCITPTITKGGG